jgi:hypothetical protein
MFPTPPSHYLCVASRTDLGYSELRKLFLPTVRISEPLRCKVVQYKYEGTYDDVSARTCEHMYVTIPNDCSLFGDFELEHACKVGSKDSR